jgi:antitoxin component YwqK of YwqJK toxin-antitoxin module
MLNRINLSAITVLVCLNCLAQNKDITFFYEVIKDDSLKMFFNERNHFIDKQCADYTRYVRINGKGDFNSYFEDLDKDNLTVGRGYYANGSKHGAFETYYPDGKVRVKGYFSNNMPAGQWEYFYENGLPERTLKFTGTDTLLVRFVDKKGNITVADGNGDFNGYVQGLSKYSNGNSLLAKGNVVNGKPHGKWTSTYFNRMYAREVFDQGKLVRGSFPEAQFNKPYFSRPHLNTFLLSNYFEALEDFRTERCADSSKYVSFKKYSFDMQKFKSDLGTRIDQVIENDFRKRDTKDYVIGDQYITVGFSVGKDGKPNNFSLVSTWGQQYFQAITTSIGLFATFPPYQKTMYFHLKLHLPGGVTYQYNFRFSKDIGNQL